MTFISPKNFANLGTVVGEGASSIIVNAVDSYGSAAKEAAFNKMDALIDHGAKKIKDKFTNTIHKSEINSPTSYTNLTSGRITVSRRSYTKSYLNPSDSTKSREHFLQIYTGKRTSKSLRKSCVNNCVDRKNFFDTERDYIGTRPRSYLTSSFGFNQKRVDIFQNTSFLTVKDMYLFYRKHIDKFKVDQLVVNNIYGDMLSEHTYLKIKSENSSYTIRFKVHVCMLKNAETSVQLLSQKMFHKVTKSDNKRTIKPIVHGNAKYEKVFMDYRVPRGKQISDVKAYSNFKHSVLVDKKLSLNESTYFSNNVIVLDTYQRNLGPGDILHFDHTHNFGVGLHLNKVFCNSFSQKQMHLTYPISTFLIVEAFGDPRASVTRKKDGENFSGESPGLYTYSMKKKVKYCRKEYYDSDNSEEFTIRQFSKKDDDFKNSEFRSRFYGNRTDRINVDFDDIHLFTQLEDKNKKGYVLRESKEARATVYMDPWINPNNFRKDVLSGIPTDSSTPIDDRVSSRTSMENLGRQAAEDVIDRLKDKGKDILEDQLEDFGIDIDLDEM